MDCKINYAVLGGGRDLMLTNFAWSIWERTSFKSSNNLKIKEVKQGSNTLKFMATPVLDVPKCPRFRKVVDVARIGNVLPVWIMCDSTAKVNTILSKRRVGSYLDEVLEHVEDGILW
jgi:hypothetical protein